MIKHVSFDLWYTLIKSNPQFGQYRNMKFQQILNAISQVSLSKLIEAHKKIKLIADPLGEISGIGLNKVQLYFFFLSELYGKDVLKIIESYPSLIDELSQCNSCCFEKYPPLLIDEQKIKNLLDILSKKFSLSILSNTSFANGNDLRMILKIHGIHDYFNFMLFSDEIGFFKPNPRCFNILYHYGDCTANIREEILHIGDNENADILGAKNAGMQSFLFSPSNPNYEDIFTFIEK